MPINPTYPGIYIEELPGSTHTITPAPTSITVFVGYSHPFKTQNFLTAVQLFSFTDYERFFGGFFSSDLFDTRLAYAVNQFFLNGGTNAYIVGLQPQYYDSTPTAYPIVAPSLTIDPLIFTALEPVDLNHPMTIVINNLQASDPMKPNVFDTADITITYGVRVEAYRKVSLNTANAQNFVETRIGTAAQPISSLVTVAPTASGYGTGFAAITATTPQYFPSMTNQLPTNFVSTFNPADFFPVFQQDSSLDKVHIFNLLVLPGITDNGILSEALAFCERKLAFLIMDPPIQYSADGSNNLPLIADAMTTSLLPTSPNGALYFPYLLSSDLQGNTIELPPSGFVVGIYARTDTNRGVWKAPAGLETIVNNTTGVVERGLMNDPRQGVLNPLGINCLRTFPSVGTVVFGARTLVTANPSFEQVRYVPVRRMMLFIEQSLYDSLKWAIFEPNDEPLWFAMRHSVEAFMQTLFRQQAFQGDTPDQAYQVKCDSTTTTQDDINLGIVNLFVAFAPLKPAEFVVVKIAQLAGQAQA